MPSEAGLEPLHCSRCAAKSPPGARFCSTCGSRLIDTEAPHEERRLVSVLFVDLVGFTARSHRTDPEDVRDALGLYHSVAKQRIEQHGGIIEKFAGDAVMAVFGAPIAHGDDAERAVRAGLAILDGLDEMNSTHGLDLAARAAVNTGVSMGASREGEALAIGDVVNTASRLQTAAPEGRLIVGEDTYRATHHSISYEPMDAVDAKGKVEPVPAWLAIEPLLAPAQRPIGGQPLVGRNRELELIGSLWSRTVAERRPHLISLIGPPGIGKTRLCWELSSLVPTQGGQIIRGRCLPYGAQTGYQAFSQIVRSVCGILESDPRQVALEKLHRAIEGLLPTAEAPDLSRYLAFLLGIGSGDGVEEPRLLFFAARRFVESVGLLKPTVLLFEDVHWAQRSELDLLEYLASYVREAPVLLIAPARLELLDVRPTWGSGLLAHTTILLDPLSGSDAAELATHLIGPSSSVQVTRLVEVAEGNPLFLEELAASVSELGGGAQLPVTVREAIASRIDAVPAAARATLVWAAVIGKTFWRGLLSSVAGIDDLDEGLSILEARQLIRREPTSQVTGDMEFTFKHMLIREVAYSTVPRSTRRERHAAIARYVEEAIQGSGETLAGVLAHHWQEAGEDARAIPYLLEAAEAAFRGWAQGAVDDLYAKAIDLAKDQTLRLQIRLKRGIALVRLGEYELATSELSALAAELEGEDRLQALLAWGRATLWRERDVETIQIAQQALALAQELRAENAKPPALALLSQAHAMRGMAGDLDRALDLGERALATWSPGRHEYDRAEHLHLHADTAYWTGRYERCAELARSARSLSADVHSAEGLLRGGGIEALALVALGRHEEAIRIWDEMFTLAKELGANRRVILNYSSIAYRELLDIEEARRRSEEALELSADESFGMPRRFAQSDLLFTDLLTADVGRAQTAWPKLWDDAGSATGWTKWLIYGRLAAARAEIALRAEAPDSAVEWAHRSLEIARRTRRRKYEARSLAILGQALILCGRHATALKELEAGVVVADSLVGPPARWDARAALARAAYAVGNDELADTAHSEAVALVESFASTLSPGRREAFRRAVSIRDALSSGGVDC